MRHWRSRSPCSAFTLPLWISTLLPPLSGAQENLEDVPVRIYRKVAPATVFVQGGKEKGSGVIIDPTGIILTSPTACGSSTRKVKVLTQGQKLYDGRVIGRANEKELVLVKIDASDLPSVELGDSDRVRLGQIACVLGDAYESLEKDDQPAISVGVVSGIYEVRKRLQGSLYTGKVLETSAAVNREQDGGPLVDRHGRLIGLVTLNYEESRFAGLAIPINELKRDIERILREFKGGGLVAPQGSAGKAGEAWLGLEVRASKGGLEVTRVTRHGPAEKAGVRPGDILRSIDAQAVAGEETIRKAVASRMPGEGIRLTILRDGETRVLAANLGRKPVY